MRILFYQYNRIIGVKIGNYWSKNRKLLEMNFFYLLIPI
jgi:hypothetical protein